MDVNFDTMLFQGDLISYRTHSAPSETRIGTVGLSVEYSDYNSFQSYAIYQKSENENEDLLVMPIPLSSAFDIKVLKRGAAYEDTVKGLKGSIKMSPSQMPIVSFDYQFGESVCNVLERWVPMLNKLAEDYNKRVNDGKNS